MNQENYQALIDYIDDISERVTLHRQAVGFLSDHVGDNQLMANLMMIEQAIEETEKMFFIILCQPSKIMAETHC